MPVDLANPIHSFFMNVYGQEPIKQQLNKKNPELPPYRYCANGADASVLIDPYGGCHLNVDKIAGESIPILKKQIGAFYQTVSESDTNSIWFNFKLPINPALMGCALPDTLAVGTAGDCDLIYDYKEQKLKIWKWLKPDITCTIPTGATHIIGATALLCDHAARKLLLVVNQARNESWNLPGGSFDPRLDKNNPALTALREAEDEGGFKVVQCQISSTSLVGQMQFPNNQFAPAINQIWAFAIDGISSTPLCPPENEILHAEWVSYDDILNCDGTFKGYTVGREIYFSLLAAINGLGAKEVENKGWKITHIPVTA